MSVDPRDDARWDALARSADGSLFTSPPWIRAVCDSYGFTPEARVLVGPDGRATGGFAWVRVSDVRGERIVSLPFSDRAEPFGDHAAWKLLAREALATGLPLSVRCLEGSPPADDPGLSRVGEAAWHGTPLHGTLEELHARLSPVTRRNIRAADRSALTLVASAGVDAVRRFHRLHVRLRKQKYRLLAPPVGFFERLWASFGPEDVLTVLACVDGEPVAGAMYLVWNDALYYKFGASLGPNLALRPNEAIQWAAIRWAKERRLALLDLGLSDLDQPGLVRYKRKWATDERRIVTVRANPARPDARASEVGGILGHMTRLFTDDAVPDEVSAEAGAVLYRYFC